MSVVWLLISTFFYFWQVIFLWLWLFTKSDDYVSCDYILPDTFHQMIYQKTRWNKNVTHCFESQSTGMEFIEILFFFFHVMRKKMLHHSQNSSETKHFIFWIFKSFWTENNFNYNLPLIKKSMEYLSPLRVCGLLEKMPGREEWSSSRNLQAKYQ